MPACMLSLFFQIVLTILTYSDVCYLLFSHTYLCPPKPLDFPALSALP